MPLNGILVKKLTGCDFDIAEFDERYFEVHGWGWKGILGTSRILGIIRVKGD